MYFMACLVRPIFKFGEGGKLLEEIGWNVWFLSCVVKRRHDPLLIVYIGKVVTVDLLLA